MAYGASREEWNHFSNWLGLTPDLLPVVSNPRAEFNPMSELARVSKAGALPKPGKVPSLYDSDRLVVGLPRWTKIRAVPKAIDEWRKEADYGICIQTRSVRAIDVDVPDRVYANTLREDIAKRLGVRLPERFRADSGKFLLVYTVRDDDIRPKRVCPVNGGIIEFLGDGQQFIAVGTHPDGERYQWTGGLPDKIPVLDADQIEKLWEYLLLVHATGEGRIARIPLSRVDISGDLSEDERYGWLTDNWDVYGVGGQGQLFLRCPFEDEHTSDSGPSATAYFPAGVGGYVDKTTGEEVRYERGHWRCLHAHCESRSDSEFDTATGYSKANFPVAVVRETLPDVDAPQPHPRDEPWPKFQRNKAGLIMPTMTNIVNALLHPGVSGMFIAYDSFLDALVCADEFDAPGEQRWETFRDEHYVAVRMTLERRGFAPMGKEALREAVWYTGARHTIDSAVVWLTRLVWDGNPRISRFCSHYLGAADTEYTRAVSRYWWTAHAGRVLSPGCQADMVPVLIGAQGKRKTSAIKAMAPATGMYVAINLEARDDDLSRKLRGKLVCELDELRGMNSRQSEDIKAWVTRTHEEWVPKFKEFGTTFPRRFVLTGSGNKRGFLADITGERRWLPFEVRGKETLRVEEIAADRDQLWAEAALVYREGGIAWQDAERLAPLEHAAFKVRDVWVDYLTRWAMEGSNFSAAPATRGFTIAEALSAALHLTAAQATSATHDRAERALDAAGFRQCVDDLWRR